MRIQRLIASLLFLGTLVACGGGELEVRTFTLDQLDPEAARRLIEPYVFADREGGPGTLSVTDGAVTVRERPENLERIAEVLQRHDRRGTGVTLQFHIIEAVDSAGSTDVPEEIVRALQPVLRYPGYRLVTSSILQGTAGELVSQVVGDQERGYRIMAAIAEALPGGTNEAGSVRMEVSLAQRDPGVDLLHASVNVPDGKSVVLGSARPYGSDRAILLVVRPSMERIAAPDDAP